MKFIGVYAAFFFYMQCLVYQVCYNLKTLNVVCSMAKM